MPCRRLIEKERAKSKQGKCQRQPIARQTRPVSNIGALELSMNASLSKSSKLKRANFALATQAQLSTQLKSRKFSRFASKESREKGRRRRRRIRRRWETTQRSANCKWTKNNEPLSCCRWQIKTAWLKREVQVWATFQPLACCCCCRLLRRQLCLCWTSCRRKSIGRRWRLWASLCLPMQFRAWFGFGLSLSLGLGEWVGRKSWLTSHLLEHSNEKKKEKERETDRQTLRERAAHKGTRVA